MTEEARIGALERAVKDLAAQVRQLGTKRDKPSEQIYPSRRASSTTVTNTTEVAAVSCALESDALQSWGSDNVADELDWDATPVFTSGTEHFTPGATGIAVVADGSYFVSATIYATSGSPLNLLAWLTVNGSAQTVKQRVEMDGTLTVGGDSFGGCTVTSVLELTAGQIVSAAMAQQGAVDVTDVGAGSSQLFVQRLD